MKPKLIDGIINGVIALAGFFILTSMAHAQGTLLKQVTLPVVAAIGVGIEADCDGNLYYTNYSSCDNHLYKMDKNGKLLSTVKLVDSTGANVSIGAISWDNGRQMLWGGSQCDYSPIRIYLIDPVTGLSKYKFTAHTAGNYLDDGIAYDYTDGSIWITPDVSKTIDHHKEDGTYLGTLTPSIPTCSGCDISGVLVGAGDMLYLGLAGKGIIVQIKKSNGSYISSFYSPGGRDEDLACDPVNFFPKLVVWSRDAYNNTIDAIEVSSQTCVCGAVVVPPVAGFQSVKTTGCVFDCFNFTDLSTNATSWSWTFSGAADSVSTQQNPQNVCYLQTGTYNVKLVVSGPGGKDSTTIYNYIHIKPGPPLPPISLSGSVLYTNSDPSYRAYQWYDSTALIPGATDTFLVVTHSGNYNLEVMNTDSCWIASGINIVLASESFTTNPLFISYPNPVTDELRIYRSADLSEAKITIYNMAGEMVYTGMMTGKIKTIDCRSFSTGLYFIRLASEQYSWSKRFMCVAQPRR